MANSFFSVGLNTIAQAGIDLVGDTIAAALVSTTYTPNLSTDDFLSDVPGGAIVAAGVALTSKSMTGSGVYNAANTTWTSVGGSAAAYILLYNDTGVAGTSNLIALYDTATGLPVTPNGGDITAAWNSGQVFVLASMLSERDRKLIREVAREDPSALDRVLGWIGGLWLPEPALLMP